jgi:3D (Asp-Asp-Asp) domain-containing protein
MVKTMEVTGYDSGPISCGWKRNWFGMPVHASGPNKGKRKRVGITASGARARPGTVAADTRYYPFGTVVYVPGYGYGRVEDRGSAIKGNRLDLFFTSRKQALKWGRQTKQVKIWIPEK